MGSLGVVATLALMAAIGIGLLAVILYLNSVGTYGSVPIGPTVNAFVEAIVSIVVVLVVVVLARR